MISSELHRQMLEHSSMCVLLTDSSNTIVYANTRVRELFGFADSELAGKPIESLFAHDMLSSDQNKIHKANPEIKIGSIRIESYYLGVKKNGAKIPLQLKATIISSGPANYVLWELQERSAEQKLLYDLKERVKEQTALLSVTEILLGAKDVRSTLADCLEPICKGWQFPEFTQVEISVGEWGTYTTPEFGSVKWRQTANVSGNGGLYGAVAVGYSDLPPESTGNVFLPEEERLISGLARLIGMFLDQCHVISKLKESNDQILRITSHTPANTYMFEMFDDKPMKIHFAVKGFVNHFDQMDMDALVVNPEMINDVIHEEDLPRFYAEFRKAHLERTNISVQYRIIENGVVAWRWLRASPDELSDGRIMWYASAQDISAIVEYTSVLEQIIFDISHVIRRPVSTMMGITDLLNDHVPIDEKTLREVGKHMKAVALEMDGYIKKLNAAYLERKVNAAPLPSQN